MTDAARAGLIEALRARLEAPPADHPGFVGRTPEGLPLTPHELGEVEAALWRAVNDAGAPHARALAAEVLRSCRAAGVTARYTAQSAERALAGLGADYPLHALAILAAFDGEPSDAMRAQAVRHLQGCRGVSALAPMADPAPLPLTPPGAVDNHILGLPALALARLAGEPWLGAVQALARTERAGARYLLAEREALLQVPASALAGLARRIDWFQGQEDGDRPDPAIALADDPGYQAHARACLEQAAAVLDDLHAGRIPYVADGVFTTDDTPTLSRAARVAAMHDAPWFRALVGPLLTRSVVAPTAAKTAPSQSLSIALGRVIERYPTPEGVQGLKDALAVVRHAGVEKKLARHLKPAQRNVAARPEVALRLLPGAKADRKQQAFVATCLEATFCRPGAWPLADWREQLALTSNGAPFAFSLLWFAQAGEGVPATVRAVEDKKRGLHFIDVEGARVDLAPDARLRLWHPLHATPRERAAWQRAFVGLRMRQPLRQVFREIYEPHDDQRDEVATDEFAGHHLRLQTLIGVARGEGWTFGDHVMTRRFGDVRAQFVVGANLYPGLDGTAPSGELGFQHGGGGRWRHATLGELDPVVVSEACRAVDLLVSVSAFGLEDESEPRLPSLRDVGVCVPRTAASSSAPEPATSARLARGRRVRTLAEVAPGEASAMRRRVLALVLADAIAAGRVVLEARHVRVGDATVHLATGRVVENGAAIELAAPEGGAALAAVPWLPYDEVLLQRIADRVAVLLARGAPSA